MIKTQHINMVNRLSKSKKRPISTRTRIAFNRAHTYHDRQKNLKIPVQPKDKVGIGVNRYRL